MKPLNQQELRVIGSLIEKAITTPDQYPLSLNALTAACNQKSNRDPVMHLSEREVQDTLDHLMKSHLVVEKSSFGGRTSKYQHRFCNTEFSDLHLSDQQLGIVCVLFLRGPQTPGELRTRSQRLCHFKDVTEVETLLDTMAGAESPLVRKLPRQPGKRESRYVHLLGTHDAIPLSPDTQPTAQRDAQDVPISNVSEQDNMALAQRVSDLEAQVQSLRVEWQEFRAQLSVSSDS